MWSIGHSVGALDRMRSADAARAATAAGAALRTWVVARDAVVRGLVHALSNRVGTVVAASGLLEAGSAEVAERVLAGESDRLEALLAQFRLVTADPLGADAAIEPVVLAEVVDAAVGLQAQVGEVRVTRVGVDEAPPVLASRAGLLHALVVLLGDARDGGVVLRAEVEAGGGVRVSADGATREAVSAAGWVLAGGKRDGEMVMRALGG